MSFVPIDRPSAPAPERRGPATLRRGSQTLDGGLTDEQKAEAHEWELKRGIVPIDDAHPHAKVEERFDNQPSTGNSDHHGNHGRRGSHACMPHRGSMSESGPLSPEQAREFHDWQLKRGMVQLPSSEAVEREHMQVD